jgi:glycosyltransferase involved in cell wall biosynthesis
MQDRLSVIFSFRNEAEVLEELIKRVVDVLDAEPEEYEIIFVNDDSADSSLQILKQQREKNPRIKSETLALLAQPIFLCLAKIPGKLLFLV